MAARKGSSSSRGAGSGSGNKRKNTGRSNSPRSQAAKDRSQAEVFRQEIILWAVVAISLLLFISNLGIGGAVGGEVSSFLFGVFGLLAYVFPVVLLGGSFFVVSNRGNRFAVIKIIAVILLVVFLCMFSELIAEPEKIRRPFESYAYSCKSKLGGGLIGGGLAYSICTAFGKAGAYIIDVIVLIISVVLLTGHSAMKGVQSGGKKVYKTAKVGYESAKEGLESAKEERRRRMDQKVVGVAVDTRIVDEKKAKKSDEISELHPLPDTELADVLEKKITQIAAGEERDSTPLSPEYADPEPIQGPVSRLIPETAEDVLPEAVPESVLPPISEAIPEPEPEPIPQPLKEPPHTKEASVRIQAEGEKKSEENHSKEQTQDAGTDAGDLSEDYAIREFTREYIYPPVSLLKGAKKKKSGNMQAQLRETALKLQQTLKTFGVNVTVTDISCGPAVTRYEIQPEMGVKVSKIVNLADDIKLNLAAADIRIEAPIPGKAAVGIEVPNAENVMVSFRELIESEEFLNSESRISFAVGRDIAGKVKVADIAKMPHVLIAGATGSGKSVCINTIIMSILYKADPNEVKLIMIDPKVVELSVYNGIPHLMIPVVTDPKKAAGALNWAVEEMSERYQKFAETGVRKFEEYNAKIDKIQVPPGQEAPKKMAQIVIIVDELADLMMVASHDVEDAICRLAQLARAAGIHLVIATQRPSVNVITGLIKANMPSRIAFAVTSGIDSRTILDMNGAEKLLGKGDMLFNPQGIPKPLRVQGAFVSDDEVSDVVEFIKEHNGAADYSSDVQQKVENLENSGNTTVEISDGDAGNGRDSYFEEAAKIIVDKEKASIGMLQRYLKVGFNRAARIMDQLEEAGIVGPEEGTKPRKVLMNPEEFQQFIDGM